MSAVSNDLANASTTGYKHTRVGFRDLMYQQAGRPTAGGDATRTGTGAAAVDAGRAMSQGSLKRTDQPLDVAIQGQGFLRIRLADGREGLTRDGALRLDGAGRLLSSGGAAIQPAITLPKGTTSDQISIAPDGGISAGGRRLGRLELVNVRAPQGLMAAGGNTFVATAASGPVTRAPGTSTVAAGALEASNVNMSDAMVEMIDAQRSYQLASKAITMADQMMEIANGVKR